MAARMVSGVRRSQHITTVLEDLHQLYLLVSQSSSRRPWWSGGVFMCHSSVSQRPLHAYPLLPSQPDSQVVSICDLQRLRLALYWFHAPGLQLDNEVSQSTDQPHGTVCHQHSTTVTWPVGKRLQAATEDAHVLDRPAPLKCLYDSGAYNMRAATTLTFYMSIYPGQTKANNCKVAFSLHVVESASDDYSF